MASEGEAFAESAAAAVREQGSEAAASTVEGGAPLEGGTQEPAGEDLSTLAAALKSAGVTPETARDAVRQLAYVQTPQGRQEYWNAFLNSEAGRTTKEQFGREHLAALLSQPNGPKQMAGLLKEWGYDPATEEADVPEEGREVRAIKQQQVALEQKLRSLEQGNQQLQGRLAQREEVDTRKDAFVDWAQSRPAMNQKAYAAIATRAHELAKLYPDQYRGSNGFKQAASDAHSQLTSIAPVFQPKPRPRGLMAGGGGVSGKGGVDTSKLSLKEQIALEADIFASAVRSEEE